MTVANPFATALRTASAVVKTAPRRDKLDQVQVDRYVSGQQFTGWSQAVTDAFTDTPVPTATAKQLAYITDLFAQRDLSGETRPKFAARLASLAESADQRAALTVQEASNLITYLKSRPIADRTPVAQEAVTEVVEPEQIPAGRYAYTGTEGHTVFVRVDAPTEGKWAGRNFAKLQVSDEFRPMERTAQAAALAAIREQGIRESAIRYGHELGVCSQCGRGLTKEASRIAGIGPKCAAGAGW